MINVGIVGYGFVGAAVEHGFKRNNIFIADPKLGTTCKDLLDKSLDIIFICAPTPMGQDGKINASIVEQILGDLSTIKDIPIVLKSTVTPEIVHTFSEKYSNFVYNPEFLTERNALNDFVNPVMHVFGGTAENTEKLEKIYSKYSSCKETKVFHMTAKEASFVKYSMNTFLATKVVFFNQLYDVCQNSGVDYNSIIAAVSNDNRIGSSHTMVPGHDGKRYFGGSCFPKDATAFIAFTGSKMTVLNEAVKMNNLGRREYELDSREKEQNVSFNIKS